jgi:amino acid transporter
MTPKNPPAKLRTLPLAFAMFCLVSGGPYGLEPVIGNAGVSLGLLLIIIMPIIWAVPTALMTAELSAAIPAEGGYYVWVRRAFGPGAGFQCAWLSWLYSIVDAALYPLLFAEYLSHNLAAVFHLELGESRIFTVCIALLHIAFVTFLNLRGITSVGKAATILTFLIVTPFFFLLMRAGVHAPPATGHHTQGSLAVGLATVMWNYLGWDNLSTVSGEVENPQKTIPRALGIAVPLVLLVYLLPTLAALPTTPNPNEWQDGSWPQIATNAAGPLAGSLVLFGGLASATAMFVSQMLASSRIPAVLAEDGYFPAILARVSKQTGVPTVSVLLCAGLYTCFSWFSFRELITVNAILYGLSILFEFAALVALRLKEPNLPRPFRIPGGPFGLVLLGFLPLCLVVLLAITNLMDEGWLKQFPTSIAILLGIVIYRLRRPKARS